MDAPAAARKILEVAGTSGRSVLFLGLCADRAQEASLRRQLIILSAMIRDAGFPFELKIESGRDWLPIVKSHWREGDALVCFAGQKAASRRTSLGLLLQTNIPATLYVLNVPSQAEKNARPKWLSSMLAWVGSIGIIVGSFLLQVRVDQTFSSWAAMPILFASLLAEGWLVWVWNNLIG
jgi:hypothetical protein